MIHYGDTFPHSTVPFNFARYRTIVILMLLRYYYSPLIPHCCYYIDDDCGCSGGRSGRYQSMMIDCSDDGVDGRSCARALREKKKKKKKKRPHARFTTYAGILLRHSPHASTTLLPILV